MECIVIAGAIAFIAVVLMLLLVHERDERKIAEGHCAEWRDKYSDLRSRNNLGGSWTTGSKIG